MDAKPGSAHTRAHSRHVGSPDLSPQQPRTDSRAFEPPYEANDLVALAFARYPYPEFFFGWTPASSGTVMFARTDRLPSWISAHERADVYPVDVRRDPPEIVALRRRVEQDIASRRRYSVFDTLIEGFATRSSRSSSTRTRAANNSTVSSAWLSIWSGPATTISATS